MTPDEVQAAVLAFLDQFIGRGAAADIVSIRERLSTEPEAQRLLLDQLPSDAPSEREAFDAMRAFMQEMWERTGGVMNSKGGPGLGLLLSWTKWEQIVQGVQETKDPAQWHDWLESVARAREQSV